MFLRKVLVTATALVAVSCSTTTPTASDYQSLVREMTREGVVVHDEGRTTIAAFTPDARVLEVEGEQPRLYVLEYNDREEAVEQLRARRVDAHAVLTSLQWRAPTIYRRDRLVVLTGLGETTRAHRVLRSILGPPVHRGYGPRTTPPARTDD